MCAELIQHVEFLKLHCNYVQFHWKNVSVFLVCFRSLLKNSCAFSLCGGLAQGNITDGEWQGLTIPSDFASVPKEPAINNCIIISRKAMSN